MNKLLDLILCSGITLLEVLAVLFIALIIQGIMYRVFKINLYKIILNTLDQLERRVNV